MSHGIPENRIVCQTGKHVVPFRLDFVSISDRKDRAIELTESKFYIKSRRQLESEREGTRRFEAPINEDRGDAEWRERMLHWEGEPLSQWMNRPSREKANVRMEHRNSTKMRLGARPSCVFLSDPVPTTSVLDLESLSTDLSLVIDTREIKRHA